VWDSGRGRGGGERKMRYGVISDVHANLPALEAVVAELERIGVDAYACAGDLVGYGPQPNECVKAIRQLGAVTVAGNHDLIAIGQLSEDRCERLARQSLRWTRGVLDEETRDYLGRLPQQAPLAGGVLVTHGSLNDPQEYVLDVERAAAQLNRLSEQLPAARILVVGHTHRAFATDGASKALGPGANRRVSLNGSDRWLLNPGAVGQSRERLVRARYMVLDLERGEAIFHATRYDVPRTRALLREQRLPPGSVHLAPWRLKALLRPAIRTTRRALAAVRHR
jgi:predicted phosphodiesterase